MIREDYIMRSFKTCTFHQIYWRKEICWECSAYGRQKRCIQGFGGETLGKETTWKTEE